MAAKVLVGNLPPETTEEEVKQLFAEIGAEAEVLKMSGEGGADSVTATVSLDLDPTTAQIMADRARKRHFKGRELSFYVPRFMR